MSKILNIHTYIYVYCHSILVMISMWPRWHRSMNILLVTNAIHASSMKKKLLISRINCFTCFWVIAYLHIPAIFELMQPCTHTWRPLSYIFQRKWKTHDRFESTRILRMNVIIVDEIVIATILLDCRVCWTSFWNKNFFLFYQLNYKYILLL